jgi:hypothetical protein
VPVQKKRRLELLELLELPNSGGQLDGDLVHNVTAGRISIKTREACKVAWKKRVWVWKKKSPKLVYLTGIMV